MSSKRTSRIADDGGPDGRQPVAGIPRRTPPHVRDLTHQRSAVAVNAISKIAEMRDNIVATDVDLAVDGARIASDWR